MNIGELSSRSGVSQRSLRYYEQQGLLTPRRAANGYRQYTEADVSLAQTIRAMYEIGFSREAVTAVLPCAAGGVDDDVAASVRVQVEAMCAELTSRIDDLTRTRALLTDFLAQDATAGCVAARAMAR